MKSNRKTKLIILIILGILFAFSPIITNDRNFNMRNNDKSSDYCDDISFNNLYLKISALSPPIHIDDTNPSMNWSVAKDAGICTGSGTYSDPYVIEDIVIDGERSGSCILIENSDVYFKIENCTVFNAGSLSQDAGISLQFVNNGLLFNNSALNNRPDGIWVSDSNNITILGNILNYNWQGITLSGTNNVISENNANNNYEGIGISNSINTIISGNTANNNFNENGIETHYSHNTTIVGNTANNNFEGIGIKDSSNTIVSGNTANNNNHNGIGLHDSNNIMILGNTANYNDFGIWLSNSDYNTVSGNILLNNTINCITELNCVGNEFFDNSCPYGEGDGERPIPGYNLFILLGILSVVAILICKKVKKS